MKLPSLLLAGAVLSPLASHAVLIYGLTSTNGLVRFDSATPGAVTSVGIISQPGIVDIDFYPVNGLLYGANSTGNLYTINTATGSATFVQAPASTLTGVTDIDFNPAADRIRVFSGGNTNSRLSPNVGNNVGFSAGAVTTDGIFNAAFNLVGSAYTNNFDNFATAPDLFSIDSNSNNLYRHSTAGGDPVGSFNQLNLVGPLMITAGTSVGFDIGQDGIAYLSSGNNLYTANLTTGAATLVGAVGGTGLVSIAAVAVPEASTASVLLLTGLCALRRRRA